MRSAQKRKYLQKYHFLEIDIYKRSKLEVEGTSANSANEYSTRKSLFIYFI